MKYYILLILLVTHTVLCYSQNNTSNTKWKDSIEAQLYIQQQRIDKYEATLEDKAKNIEEKLNMRNEYVDYKKEHVSWWLNVVGLLVAIFGVIIPIGISVVGFIVGRGLVRDINAQKKEAEAELKQMKDEINKMIKDGENCMAELYTHKDKALITVNEIIKTKGEADNLINSMILSKENTQISLQIKDSENSPSVTSNRSLIGKINEAKHKFRLKDYKQAISMFNTILSQDPNLPTQSKFDINYHIGLSNSVLKRHDVAIAKYIEAIELAKQDITIHSIYKDELFNCYNNLGVAHMDEGDINLAISYFTKSIDIDNDNVLAYYNLGVAYTNINKVKKALEYLEKAISVNPQYSDIYHQIATIKFLQKDYKNAIKNSDVAISITSKDKYLSLKAESLIKIGDNEQAISICNSILKNNNKNSSAYTVRALANGKLKNYSEAKSDYFKALETTKNPNSVLTNIAELEIFDNKPHNAENILSKIDSKMLNDNTAFSIQFLHILIQILKGISDDNLSNEIIKIINNILPDKIIHWDFEDLSLWLNSKHSDFLSQQQRLQMFELSKAVQTTINEIKNNY